MQARAASEDVMLGQHLIPAGTRVWVNVRSLHLDEKNFANAKVIDQGLCGTFRSL